MKEFLLARSFLASARGRGLHGSFLISVVAVAIGSSFLILTLGVYDSYAAKLETIAWSIYPHVMVFDDAGGARGGETGQAEIAGGFGRDAVEGLDS